MSFSDVVAVFEAGKNLRGNIDFAVFLMRNAGAGVETFSHINQGLSDWLEGSNVKTYGVYLESAMKRTIAGTGDAVMYPKPGAEPIATVTATKARYAEEIVESAISSGDLSLPEAYYVIVR